MKNIIGFNKFKKLYEEADAGVLADEKTMFANVKGNFAGAETTLIGSNVIRLFNFFKRKGSQAILWTVFRPNLYREYMKGLFRAIIRHDLELPKPKTLYDATLIKDVEENKVEEKTFKVQIKIIKTSEGEYEQFKIGSEVLTEDGNKLEQDGIYRILNKDIKIEDSKITEISPAVDDRIDEIEDEIEDTKDIEDTEEESKVEKHIVDFINDIKTKYDNLDDVKKPEFYNKYIQQIQSIKKIFQENIKEINKIINNDDNAPSKIERAVNDLPVFEENIKALDELIQHIQPKEKTSVKKKEETPVQLKKDNVLVTDNYNIGSFINEEIDVNKKLVKPGKEEIIGNGNKIGDELNLLSQVNVDLEDQEWLKQFNDPDIKKKVTLTVLESKPEIVKLQLGAERFYTSGSADGGVKIDRKLYNSWLKMVEGVKSKFTRFMDVDMVDPLTIKKGLGQDLLDKYKKAPDPAVAKANAILDHSKIDKNNTLKQSLSQKPFIKQNEGSFGIMRINNEAVVYCLNNIEINNDKHPTYKIIGSLDFDKMLDESKDDKKDFSDFLKKEELPDLLKPREKNKTISTVGDFKYVHTFIISPGTDNLITSGTKASGFILYVYAKNTGIKEINESNINNFYFMYRTPDGKDVSLNPTAPTTGTVKNKVSMVVSPPYHIDNTYISNFGLSEDDRKPNLRSVSKKYTFGELKKY